MASDDYYAILGVAPGAQISVIQAAYRDLMRRFHPDVNATAEADARAKAINEAYACLRDEARRASYDWQRRARSANARSARARSAYARSAYARYADVESKPQRSRPGWSGPTSAGVRSKAFTLTWGKAVGLGIAALITLITFAMTSATPPPGAVVIGRDGEVVMKVVAGPDLPDAFSSGRNRGRPGR